VSSVSTRVSSAAAGRAIRRIVQNPSTIDTEPKTVDSGQAISA
jgi:hypothetical protein